uniref:Putative NADH dehydrogenase n=1 Tax=viral metagenome TaxID=1070528 RepID=A0A6M3MDD0_9ZZZZ
MEKKIKVLLTGDAGFIGGYTALKLEELGYDVGGMDIKRGKREDIRDMGNVLKAFGIFEPDVVVHLAALAGVRDSVEEYVDYYDTNITGLHHMLEASRIHKVKKFLFASSSSVYGGLECPLKEDMQPLNPLSPYGVSKLAGELLCRIYSRHFPIVAFRPFTVYGKNGRVDQVVGKITDAGINGKVFYRYGDGTSNRGYTNVNDLVDGIARLIDYEPKDNFDVFNLGGTEIILLSELIDTVKGIFPSLKVEQRDLFPVDPVHSYADVSKAKEKLGWEPKRNFKEEILKICKTSKNQKKS